MSRRIFYLFILISACTSKKSEPFYKELNPTGTIKINSDQFFHSNVFDLEYYKGHMILCENDYNRLTIYSELDKIPFNTKLENDEFKDLNYPMRVYANNDTVFVYSAGNQQINFYNLRAEFLGYIKLKTPSSDLRSFYVQDGFLFYSTDIANKPFVKVNIHSGDEILFGEFLEKEESRFGKIMKSQSFLYPIAGNKIVAILTYAGIARVYNSNLELEHEINYLEVPELNETKLDLEATYEKNKGKYITKETARDVKVLNNDIFILLWMQKAEQRSTDHVLHLQYSNEEPLSFKGLYQLNELEEGKRSQYFTFAAKTSNELLFSNTLNEDFRAYQLSN
jgi:hypothetical protein